MPNYKLERNKTGYTWALVIVLLPRFKWKQVIYTNMFGRIPPSADQNNNVWMTNFNLNF
jgi:hypothetical protein